MALRRLIPDTIATRIVLILLVGLTVSHVASMAIYYGDPTTELTSLGRTHVAERIGTISRIVDQTPNNSRRQVLAAARNANLYVSASPTAPSIAEADAWESRLLKDALIAHLGETIGASVRVGFAPASLSTATSEDEMLHVSVMLSDGTWLNFEAAAVAPTSYFSKRFFLSTTLMAITVIVAAAWAAGRLTAPLTIFADAAERFGLDVTAPELPQAGPGEVRKAARAFNGMQRRLRRFIEDRTQMIASISHDLRTPITRLRLRAEFVEDTEQHQKMLADLNEMERMIASTLSFARDDAEAEPRETVDLVAMLHSLCDDLGDAGKPVTFEGEGRLPYRCRRIGLRRTFGNLIDNALKYGERATVTLAEEAGKIVVRIDDEGPGIPEDRIEEMFHPFHRLEGSRNRETGGTGLGLTVARSIVRGHGGELSLINKTDGGLTAQVSLPL